MNRLLGGLCIVGAITATLYVRAADSLAELRTKITRRIAAEYERARIGDPGE